jgi:hemerythrin-like domain-containing protein
MFRIWKGNSEQNKNWPRLKTISLSSLLYGLVIILCRVIIVKPTEELKKEHEAIKLMIRIMGSVSDRLESGKKVDPKHLDSILEFIKVFADKCHHAKEEDLLFPAMEKAGIPLERSKILCH